MKTQLTYDGKIIPHWSDGRNKIKREEAYARLDREATDTFGALAQHLVDYRPSLIADTQGYDLHEGKRRLIVLERIGNEFKGTDLEHVGLERVLFHFSPMRLREQLEIGYFHYLTPLKDLNRKEESLLPERILLREIHSGEEGYFGEEIEMTNEEKHVLHIAMPLNYCNPKNLTYEERIANSLFSELLFRKFLADSKMYFGGVALGQGLLPDWRYDEAPIVFDKTPVRPFVETIYGCGKKALEVSQNNSSLIKQLQSKEEELSALGLRVDKIKSKFKEKSDLIDSDIVKGMDDLSSQLE